MNWPLFFNLAIWGTLFMAIVSWFLPPRFMVLQRVLVYALIGFVLLSLCVMPVLRGLGIC